MAKPAGVDTKAWLQELRTNRQTQGALVVLLAFITWLAWPEPPKKPRKAAAGATSAAGLDPRQLAQVRKLPDLAKLDRTGELPSDAKMARDLFLFDGPPPPPPPVKPQKEVRPPEPTEAEKAARRLQEEKNQEMARKPGTLRYLGLIESPGSGQLAACMKGELPVQYQKGETVSPGWKLSALTDKKLTFQNLKFPDLTFTLEARDGGGSQPQQQAVTNEF